MAETIPPACPNCGQVIDTDSKFCKNCGADLFTPAAQASQEPAQAKVQQSTKKLLIAVVGALIGLLVIVLIGALVYRSVRNRSTVAAVSSTSPSSQMSDSNAQKSNNLTRTYRGYVAGVIEGENDYDFHVESGQIHVSASVAKNVASEIMGRPISTSEDFRYLQGSTVEVTLSNVYVYIGSGQHNVSGKLLKIIVLTIKQSVDDEAKEQANKMLSILTKQCGQYYRVAINENGLIWWPEIIHPPTTSVEGEEVQSRPLTEAERLNGVDPRPIEWKGTMIVTFGPWRSRTTQLGRTLWTGWNDTYDAHFPMTKEKGKWHINGQGGVNMLSFKCAEIPKEWRE